jgi:hypothetical protein
MRTAARENADASLVRVRLRWRAGDTRYSFEPREKRRRHSTFEE